MPLRIPKYHDLPIKPEAPKGAAWGVFDRDGVRDVYGTLNFITPEAVIEAKAEILTGESVVLKYGFLQPRGRADHRHSLPLTLPHSPCPGRVKLEHRLITAEIYNLTGCDDEILLNTQSSSQWDGLSSFMLEDFWPTGR